MLRLAIVILSVSLLGAGSQFAAAAAEGDGEFVVAPTSGASSTDESMIPLTVGGEAVDAETWSGPEWVARLDPDNPAEIEVIEATEALAAAAGSTVDELTIATSQIALGPDDSVAISAIRAPGSRSYDLVYVAADMLASDIGEAAVGWTWASDRWIALYWDADVQEADMAVIYPAGDTVWVIRAGERDAEPIVAALPPQPGPIGPIVSATQRVEVPELGIAASFPEDWMVESLPVTDEAQDAVDRTNTRRGIDAAWIGTLVAKGPQDPVLGAGPECGLMLFGKTEMSPRAWIALAIEGNQCYVVDETRDGLVRARIQPGECGRHWAPSQGGQEHFALGSDDKIAYLWCWSKDPPGERGAAIAESIEFLTEEE